MSQVYERTMQIVATPHFQTNMETLKNNLQARMDSEIEGCVVDKVWKINGITSNQDVVVVETLAPTESPISEVVVLGIIAVVLAIIGTVAMVYALGFLERREKPLMDLWHETQLGKGFESVDAMIKWKMENTPEEYQSHPYYCPYCGAEFETVDQRENHVKICPVSPVPPPPAPDPGRRWYPGYYLNYTFSAIFYRSTTTRFGLLEKLRRK